MDVTETLNEGLKRAYKIVLSAAELDQKVNEKIEVDEKDVRQVRHGRGSAREH